ncbi:Uncharacterised protein [Klebsiella variicola]|uniref:Secreted protein n=1 Tax=Klebsiella variicola TaxID=244366 RepID=A0ABD7P642_KLEVA|nr:Uncharacterised protein [Klebsiella variicola]
MIKAIATLFVLLSICTIVLVYAGKCPRHDDPSIDSSRNHCRYAKVLDTGQPTLVGLTISRPGYLDETERLADQQSDVV